VTVTQVPLSGAAAMLIGLAALAVVMLNGLWRFFQHGMVMAHEGGHAAGFAMALQKNGGIKLNANASGSTKPPVSIGWLGYVFAGALGYIGPSLFGLAAAKMIETGHIVEVLWIVLFLLALLLLTVTTKFGILTVIVAGGLVFLVVRYTPLGLQIVAAYAISWFLLLSGVRGIFEDGFRADGDAGILQGKTFVPRFIWFLFWLAGTLAAVAIGGKWLILRS
jgi:hypothetical protein